MGPRIASATQQSAHDSSCSYAHGNAISLVSIAGGDRTRQRARNSADALQQRPTRRAALDAVFVDHELLPEKRGARGGRFELVLFALFGHADRGRDRAVYSGTLDREPHFSCRFCRQLSDVYGAREYSSFHSRWRDLEITRFAYRVVAAGLAAKTSRLRRCKAGRLRGGGTLADGKGSVGTRYSNRGRRIAIYLGGG